MATVLRSGLMAQDTKATGEVTKLMGMENLFMLMEMCTKESGSTIRLTEKELTLMPMVPIIMVIG
jgi:hypothetical protein